MTVCRGDETREAALTRLMQTHEKEIVKLCCLYLGDIALAEDAAQETFLKAYRSLDGFLGNSSERTWLTRIAVNTCKDIRRAAWFRLVDRRVTLDRLPPPAVPPKQESVHLALAVMRLPSKERDAVLLHYYQGMPIREAAQALHVTPSAVSRRLKRACARLHLIWEGGDRDA